MKKKTKKKKTKKKKQFYGREKSLTLIQTLWLTSKQKPQNVGFIA